jgi:PKD repeat protein
LKWNFVGGTPAVSTEKNPIVVYNQVGNFDVTLLASNSQFQDEVAQKAYIIVKDKPTTGYLASIKLADVTFTNTSKNADSYAWSFGDGTTSIEPNPKHTYDKDSTYNVILTTTNECGQRSDTQSVVIVTPPTADFEQNLVLGCAPLTVKFKQKASYNAKVFTWQFDGGTPAISNDPNPSVIFEKGGKFNVQLTVSNAAGQNLKSKPNLITVKDKPQIAFDATLFKRKATFTNTTQNALSYTWDFGDKTPKVTDATPTHDYAKSGAYTVTLNAKNECGTATLSKEITVANLVNCDELVWKLYPNPADVETLIEFNGDLLQAMPYQIFSIDGRLFKEGIFEKETGDKAFDVTAWVDGLYIVYFECGERRFVRKLVVTKR